MAATKELVAQEFRAALKKLDQESRYQSTDWEESKLVAALEHIGADQLDEAFDALVDFNRAPTEAEEAALDPRRRRMSPKEIDDTFHRLLPAQ